MTLVSARRLMRESIAAGTGLGAFVHVVERELRPSVAEFRRFRVPVAGALEVERDVRRLVPGRR